VSVSEDVQSTVAGASGKDEVEVRVAGAQKSYPNDVETLARIATNE
jgi:hypothetical protein